MRLFHKHQWEETDRQALYRPAYHPLYGYLQGIPPSPVTLITRRCKECEKLKQEILAGWLPGARKERDKNG